MAIDIYVVFGSLIWIFIIFSIHRHYAKKSEAYKELKKRSKADKIVWYGLRTSWYVLIFTMGFLGSHDYYDITYYVLLIIGIASFLSIFIFSIIHLTKFKRKVTAIISIVLSSLWLLIFIIGLVIGSMYYSDPSGEYALLCDDICIDIKGAEYSSVNVDIENEFQYICTCLGSNQEYLHSEYISQ